MNLNFTQEQPVILVTGAARRVGAAIIRHFHAKQFLVVIHCNHSAKAGQQLADELNQIRSNSAIVLVGDLLDEQFLEKLVQQTVAITKRLDVLVNNASVFVRDDKLKDKKQLDKLFSTNVFVPFKLSQYAYPDLAKTQGCIVNITDIHALNPIANYSLYCQSKAALHVQTLSLAVEFAPRVRVNAVAPGAVIWPEGDNAISEDLEQRIVAKTPLQRHGSPEAVAKAVWGVAQNDFITGANLVVDGGRSL